MRLSLPLVVLSLSFALAAGCGEAKKEGFGTYKDKEKPKAEAHEHEEHGPHGGHLVELGDHEFHGEVAFDAKEKKVVVYVLGHELSKTQPIKDQTVTLSLMIDGKPQPFELKAVPQTGDPEGSSSRFELAGDLIVAEHIKDEEDLQGRLTVNIDGKPYSGAIEHGHEHGHDHDHDHKDETKKDDHKDEKK